MRQQETRSSRTARSAASFPHSIDFQSSFGRGHDHLSAILEEGDVVAYQTGAWLVDGVPVGEDGADPTVCFAIVETIQLVWTHNCEHGVLRGWGMEPLTTTMNDGDGLQLQVTDDMVEFGPEQLLARIPSTRIIGGDYDPFAPGVVYKSLVPFADTATAGNDWLQPIDA